MSDKPEPPGTRSVSIDGTVTATSIVTGDSNTVTTTYQQTPLPPPETVDIRAELDALREALAKLQSPDQKKINNAISEASDELEKPEPDKDEVGKALDRALGYAKKTAGFAQAIESIKGPLVKAAAWLGTNWDNILHYVGLSS